MFIFINLYMFRTIVGLIIRRNNGVCATHVTWYYSVWKTVWHAEWKMERVVKINILRKIVHQFCFIYNNIFVVYIEGAFVCHE